MENNNDIKKGDTIICINTGKLVPNNTPPPLKLNGEYICQNIQICGCGNMTYDVGISRNPEHSHGCNTCNRQTMGEDIRWCSAERFIKKKSKEEQMAEALEKEDYETLQFLKDNN